MKLDEKRSILSKHLSKFRAWSYDQLVERIDRDRREHDCLESVEGVASDGTEYQMEFNVFWDDKRGGDVRVLGDLTAEPQTYTSDVTDDFIMSPDGRFVGE
ncbi:MAG: hypothetical protein WD648_03475 [Planctomycetaceae bacterium]